MEDTVNSVMVGLIEANILLVQTNAKLVGTLEREEQRVVAASALAEELSEQNATLRDEIESGKTLIAQQSLLLAKARQ